MKDVEIRDCPKKTDLTLFLTNCFLQMSHRWKHDGIAFISPKSDKNAFTYGRMWKVTKEQFLHIWKEEGKGWYDQQLQLGHENGIPIYTITHSSELPSNKPSSGYVKTIIAGLKETYQLSDETILKYLIEKSGISGEYSEQDITAILEDKDIVVITKPTPYR